MPLSRLRTGHKKVSADKEARFKHRAHERRGHGTGVRKAEHLQNINQRNGGEGKVKEDKKKMLCEKGDNERN